MIINNSIYSGNELIAIIRHDLSSIFDNSLGFKGCPDLTFFPGEELNSDQMSHSITFDLEDYALFKITRGDNLLAILSSLKQEVSFHLSGNISVTIIDSYEYVKCYSELESKRATAFQIANKKVEKPEAENQLVVEKV